VEIPCKIVSLIGKHEAFPPLVCLSQEAGWKTTKRKIENTTFRAENKEK